MLALLIRDSGNRTYNFSNKFLLQIIRMVVKACKIYHHGTCCMQPENAHSKTEHLKGDIDHFKISSSF